MGYDYALVHLKYTIPPALLLSFIYRPLCTRLDVYKILFLICIAVTATIPWDSYLIRRKIWTYPPSVIIGPKIFDIPLEEVFFFVIQTYNTSLLYLLLSKPTLKPAYLKGSKTGWKVTLFGDYLVGQAIIGAIIAYSVYLIADGREGTYMGLIGVWAGPFAFLLRGLAYQLLVNLPWKDTLAPIVIPTIYLWIVDTFALQRGTWSISTGTKFGIHVWPHLEIEEAVFFLATNILIVFGLVAFDNALAILELFPANYPYAVHWPSPVLMVKALLMSPSSYDDEKIIGIQEAVARLQKKSRSFFLASSVFEGRLRIDLIMLYSFCRTADDLVDTAKTVASAKSWISKLTQFLDLSYDKSSTKQMRRSFVVKNFPANTQTALLLLPTDYLSSKPLYGLLEGFRIDLEFADGFPIRTEEDLDFYSKGVAGTVAELCLELVFHHSPTRDQLTKQQRDTLVQAGGRMGIALQYVNIARDIQTDALMRRVYIPHTWLREDHLKAEDVIHHAKHSHADLPKIEKLRGRLLGRAFHLYEANGPAMDGLPAEARAPMKVAVESYMEIGRVMREKGFKTGIGGKATVPWRRRIRTAWSAINESS